MLHTIRYSRTAMLFSFVLFLIFATIPATTVISAAATKAATQGSDLSVQRLFTEVQKNGSFYFLQENAKGHNDLYREAPDGTLTRIAENVDAFRVGQACVYYLSLSDEIPSLFRVRIDGKGRQLLAKDVLRIYAIYGGWVYGKAYSEEGVGGALIRVNSRTGAMETLVPEERFAYTWNPVHQKGRFYFTAENKPYSVCYDGSDLREDTRANEVLASVDADLTALRPAILAAAPEGLDEDDRLVRAGEEYFALLGESSFALFDAKGQFLKKYDVTADAVLCRDSKVYILQHDYQSEQTVYQMLED